ncbi:MAG: hypothetical protein IIB44_04570 [Candidatus Marinimicrobia bacterium]|nr:hypothetical protein [Candidatus Neomarinimicrobiota bacterium]MCH8067909.1 hypothetical protein [Candidatus Neomarinimicrobiota bacterium]
MMVDILDRSSATYAKSPIIKEIDLEKIRKRYSIEVELLRKRKRFLFSNRFHPLTVEWNLSTLASVVTATISFDFIVNRG